MAETKASLKADISDWAVRTLTDAELERIIKFGESGLNKKIPAIAKSSSALATVADSATVDISSLNAKIVRAVFIQYDSIEETEITKGSPTAPRLLTSGRPTTYTIENRSTIVFNRPVNGAYTIRVAYDEQLNLHGGDDTAENWLLEDHPDVYLAACMIWSSTRVEDVEQIAVWTQMLKTDLSGIISTIRRENKASLRVDNALLEWSE